jgi:hypothetical protein
MIGGKKSFGGRIRTAFEWLRNAYFVYQIAQLLIAWGAGKLVKAVLILYSHLDPLWISPIWLLTSGMVLFAFTLLNGALPKQRIRTVREMAVGGEIAGDAVGDFSISENPAGAWSYGWSHDRFAADFVPHTRNRTDALPGGDAWDSPEIPHMCVVHNRNVYPIDAGSFTVFPDMLNMHPDLGGLYDVVRWTCPDDGRYAIHGQFAGLDRHPVADSEVDVAINSRTSLFATRSPLAMRILHGAGSCVPIYFSNIRLAAEDTVDFIVGVGPSRGQGSDSTGLRAKIIRMGS